MSQLHVLTMFSFIDCCPTLIIMLENDVKNKQGQYEGVYTLEGFSNGMDYWVDAEGENAIWYTTTGSSYDWHIGGLAYLGSDIVATIYSSSNILKKKCPNNEGYIWNWKYDEISGSGWNYIDTNDVYIKCANEDDFCTSKNPCGTDQGDCDTHDECQDGLDCGSNNCPASLGFDSEVDCCYPGISSPNYPNLYPYNVEKTWLLTAPTGSIIILQFHSFHVRQ